MNVILENIESVIEWQCAHNALTHAEHGKCIELVYGTPDGDLALSVIKDDQGFIVSKETTRG